MNCQVDSPAAGGIASLTGIAAPYLRHDVLIDYIAPPLAGAHAHDEADIAPHSHTLTQAPDSADTGARHAFAFDRYFADGGENPGFILNQAPYRDACILLAGRNFGIGGTRTPAAARLLGCGLKAVIAPGFGPVFLDDCIQTGLLPVILGQEQVETIAAAAEAAPRRGLTIDLQRQTISRPDTGPIAFQMNARLRTRFMDGLADIDETSPFEREARAFREAQQQRQPWIYRSTGDPR